MVRSKAMVLGCVFACVAIVGLASTANAAVIAGVVGGAGVHMQYGPQNAGGDYLGIASESYETLADFALGWDLFPTWSGAQTPPDGIGFGYVLLAFNPYTGEVWNDIPVEYQALSGHPTYASMGAHTPTVGLTGVDGGGDPISSDVVQADMGRGYTEDTVFITGAFMPGPVGAEATHTYGTYLNTSSDGGILSTRGNAETIDIFGSGYYPAVGGVAGGPALMAGGEEVRPYAAGDPLRPLMYDTTDLQDQNFVQTKTWGNTPFWYDDGSYQNWWGYDGPVAGFDYYGFEMDGIRGWMKLGFTAPGAAVTGIRLTEYYFDLLTLGDFDGDSDVDADDIDILCDNMGGPVDPYDVDEDGDVDEDDVIELIETLVEWDNGVDTGVGTKQGDFNLDGVVNATDLAIMKGTYATSGVGYADGNANCDDVVNATDLAILKNNFGFIAPTGGGVPEPATLAVLTMGGMALLRRKGGYAG